MEFSVVVPTLNGRERLSACLDALAEHAPGAEVVVVNGPSTDGTTGMVRERGDVDVLVEIADRNLNVARNAGVNRADGDGVACVNYDLVVEEGWLDAVDAALAGGAAGAVTGPIRRQLRAGLATESSESRTIAGRNITYLNGGNVAFTREAVDAIDGFDEYLLTGGARDAAHRLAGLDYPVAWEPAMSARREFGADGGRAERDWGWRYRSLAYRLVKNYGPRPTVARRVGSHMGADMLGSLRGLVRGEARASNLLGNGRDILIGTGVGAKDGLVARLRDRARRRNPHGLSSRADRAVEIYDRR